MEQARSADRSRKMPQQGAERRAGRRSGRSSPANRRWARPRGVPQVRRSAPAPVGALPLIFLSIGEHRSGNGPRGSAAEKENACVQRADARSHVPKHGSVLSSRNPRPRIPFESDEQFQRTGRVAPMGFFTKDIKTMNDLFMHGLQDLYYAENQIAKSLPDMIEKATNPQLRAGFEKHLSETEGQIQRLQQVFELLEAEPKGERCPAIDGILKEGRDLMGEIDDEDVMNVGLIAAAQAVEHYEITRYGALIAWANELGRGDCVPLLKTNLAEEKATDQKLTALAERRVNPQGDKKSGGAKKSAKRSTSTARRKRKPQARPAAKSKRNGAKKARRRA